VLLSFAKNNEHTQYRIEPNVWKKIGLYTLPAKQALVF